MAIPNSKPLVLGAEIKALMCASRCVPLTTASTLLMGQILGVFMMDMAHIVVRSRLFVFPSKYSCCRTFAAKKLPAQLACTIKRLVRKTHENWTENTPACRKVYELCSHMPISANETMLSTATFTGNSKGTDRSNS